MVGNEVQRAEPPRAGAEVMRLFEITSHRGLIALVIAEDVSGAIVEWQRGAQEQHPRMVEEVDRYAAVLCNGAMFINKMVTR